MTARTATRTAGLLARLDDAPAVWTPGTFGVSIDTREQAPYKFAPSIPVRVMTLPAGDLAPIGAEDRCALDRKAIDDFVRCCAQDRERFHRELTKLAEYDFAAIVVEASHRDVLAHRYRSAVEPGVVLSSAASIAIRYGVPVFFVCDRHAGADLSLRLLRKFWEQKMGGAT